MSQKPPVPVITDLTLKTLHNLKNVAPPLYEEFKKALQKYQQAVQALAAEGVKVADTLYKIGVSHTGDLGDGIRKMAEFIKESEARRDEVGRTILADLITPLKANAETDIKEALTFEKNYKRDRDQMRADIVKLEARTKKAGKKTSPEALKQQISELNDKVKEAEHQKSTKFREVVTLERKKYCTLLQLCNTVLAKEIDVQGEYVAKHKVNETLWSTLAASVNSLPKEFEDMISKQERNQERTFVQIQPDQENYRISYAPGMLNTSSSNLHQYSYDTSSYDSYDSYDNSSYDSGAYGYDQSSGGYGYDQSGGYDQGAGGAQARALYDYQGEDPNTDLQLTAGEIVTIIQDDDGSGWTKGQNSHGQQGIFPTTYIQYL